MGFMEHDTTLEHALDIATANSKEAHRLLDQAKGMLATGDVTQERVDQLQELISGKSDTSLEEERAYWLAQTADFKRGFDYLLACRIPDAPVHVRDDPL